MNRPRMNMLPGLVLVALCLPAAGTAKSIFNLSLLGVRVESGDVRGVALGGGYQLVADSLGILQYNPAMASYARRVTIAAAQFMGTSRSQSDLYKERSTSYKFTSIAVAFPTPWPVSIGFVYRAGTDPTGEFSSQLVSQGGEPYAEQFERSGGLSSYNLVVAADLTSRIKLGLGGSLDSGRMTDTWRIAPETGEDAFSQQKRTMRGYGVLAGLAVRPFSRVTLGVTYKTPVDYDTDVDIFHTNTSVNDTYEETTAIPEVWTVSGVWAVSPNWAIHAAGQYSDFTQFEGLSFPSERLRSQEVLSLGAEQRNGPLRIPLRFSLAYERLPFTQPEDEDVTSVSGTLGTGLQLGDGRGKIDLALRIGQIGSLSANGFEDRYVRLYVGVAGSETWSRHRADDN